MCGLSNSNIYKFINIYYNLLNPITNTSTNFFEYKNIINLFNSTSYLYHEFGAFVITLGTYTIGILSSILICSYLRKKLDQFDIFYTRCSNELWYGFHDLFEFREETVLDFITVFSNIDLYFTYFAIMYCYIQYSYYVPIFSKLAIKDLIYVAMFIWKEIEKEFFSADDVLFLLSIVLCAFGWFFFLSLSIIFVNLSFFNFIITIIPVLTLITLLTPVFILFDIGMFSSNYLRGSSSSTLIIFEFIYDCIAIFILYIRIVIQNLRFIFIFVSCLEVNELAFGVGANLNFWIFNEEIFSISLYDNSWAPYFYNKYFLVRLPIYIIAGSYYVLHMLFIIISNTSAYLFLVFWLYLFLYTCFFTQKFENYLKKQTNN